MKLNLLLFLHHMAKMSNITVIYILFINLYMNKREKNENTIISNGDYGRRS
ncbi:hypothetical protein EMIT0210MI2_11181 [Priestia megaterium]